MRKLIATGLLLIATCAKAQVTTINEDLWTTNNSQYFDNTSSYTILSGSVTVGGSIGFLFPVTGIKWEDGSITTSATTGIGGSGPAGPQGPSGSNGINGSNGVAGPPSLNNFTGTIPATTFYILISTSQSKYDVMTQNTDGTISVVSTNTTTTTYDVISNGNKLAWVSVADSDSVLWQRRTPTATFTVGPMAMLDTGGTNWIFSVDADGVFRTSTLGGF